MSEEQTTPEVAVEETVTETQAPVVEETKEVEVPAEFAELISKVEAMTVLELNSLIKVIEAKWGVSAAAVSAAPAAAGAAEEQSEFEVVLVSDGGSKIPVMKAVKEILGLGLKEAKDFVEALPASLKSGVKKEDAEKMKAAIEDAGGKVELK